MKNMSLNNEDVLVATVILSIGYLIGRIKMDQRVSDVLAQLATALTQLSAAAKPSLMTDADITSLVSTLSDAVSSINSAISTLTPASVTITTNPVVGNVSQPSPPSSN
jgi:predicted negative regulator of RcsB-dependent stress response